jgi:hypothetical protein
MKAGFSAEEAIVANIVTETHAEEVLSELRPWLRDPPAIDQFREQLEAAIGRFWMLRRNKAHLAAANRAVGQARRSALHAKTGLLEVEKNAEALQMSGFVGPRLRDALIAVNELQQALSRIPEPFSGQERARKGPAPRAWYSLLVRDLANIAWEIRIDVTTAGDRADDPAATPFTRFAFAVEKLLPDGERSPSLAACAKRIDRAIAASHHELGGAIERTGRRPICTRSRDK